MKRPIGSGLVKPNDGRKQRMVMELIYIGLTLMITVLAVIVFFFQEKVSFLYSVIFLLGAVINGLTGYRYMQRDRNNKRHTVAGTFAFVIAAVLVVLAVVGIVVAL